MTLAVHCGDIVNGVRVHVWLDGAQHGDGCLCGQRELDCLGATYSAGAFLERTAD